MFWIAFWRAGILMVGVELEFILDSEVLPCAFSSVVSSFGCGQPCVLPLTNGFCWLSCHACSMLSYMQGNFFGNSHGVCCTPLHGLSVLLSVGLGLTDIR